MEKWAVIVGIATEKPDSLGFVPVAVGGTKALAELLDTSPGNVSRSLKSWEQQGAIFRFEHKGIRGLPSLVGIQVPELTDALVWFASRAFSTLEGSGAGGAPMTIPQAQKIAGNLLERRTLLPHSLRTFSQASVVLDLLSSGAANEELQAHLSRLG